MASQPQNHNSPQNYLPPTARELRAQAVRRIQIGLSGLAAMLLLVGLANIIMQRALESGPARQPVPAASHSAAPKTDPLADIGVVPTAASGPTDAPANPEDQ